VRAKKTRVRWDRGQSRGESEREGPNKREGIAFTLIFFDYKRLGRSNETHLRGVDWERKKTRNVSRIKSNGTREDGEDKCLRR